MKTKPFLLATAGSTVDGRVIDEKMLDEMAKSYDPKTYSARINLEHIRGISGQPPFRAYGDVLELSVGETDVNFNGKSEKRKALSMISSFADLDRLLDDLDPATPFPPDAHRTKRGHTRGPRPVHLPDRWLDTADDPTPPAGAELLVSGG